MWENRFNERTDSPLFFRPLEKIEKVSDFCNNGHKNIRYCYRKGGGVQVEVAWCFSFVIMTLNIKCMDRAIFLVRGDYLAPLSLLR